MTAQQAKEIIRDFWNQHPCGAGVADGKKFSKACFKDMEHFRYAVEPEVFAFAQFTRFHGQKVLEVGVGTGTDFLQWVRAGTKASGVDLSPEAVEHVRRRLALAGLEAEDLRIADGEALPYDDDTFDLVYSWGVIHHTPNPRQALAEIVRVTRPGGRCKIMVYNRSSVYAFLLWLRTAVLRGRPWKTVSWCLAHFQESPGTQALTARELREMLASMPVEQVQMTTIVTPHERLVVRKWIWRFAYQFLVSLLGPHRVGWFMTVECVKCTG